MALQRRNLDDAYLESFDFLKETNLKTAQSLGNERTVSRDLTFRIPGWAKRFFERWHKWVDESDLAPMKKKAKMLKRFLPNIRLPQVLVDSESPYVMIGMTRGLGMERRRFTREFKLAAVRKVVDLGLSCAEVARDLKVRESMIYNWRKSFEADGSWRLRRAMSCRKTANWNVSELRIVSSKWSEIF